MINEEKNILDQVELDPFQDLILDTLRPEHHQFQTNFFVTIYCILIIPQNELEACDELLLL